MKPLGPPCPDCGKSLPSGGYLSDGWHMVQPPIESVARKLFMRFVDVAKDRVHRPLSDEEMADLHNEATRIANCAQPIVVGKCVKQLERDAVACASFLRDRGIPTPDATLDELEGRK